MLRDHTIVTATNIIEQSDLISNGLDKTAIGVFETVSDWESYAKSVRLNLPSYIATERGPKQLQLRRQLPGDVFVVDIEGSAAGNSQRIRITFHAFPD